MSCKSINKLLVVLAALVLCFSLVVPIAMSEETSSDPAPENSSTFVSSGGETSSDIGATSSIVGNESETTSEISSIDQTISSDVASEVISDSQSSVESNVVSSSVISSAVSSSKVQKPNKGNNNKKPPKQESSKSDESPSYDPGYQATTSQIDYDETVSFGGTETIGGTSSEDSSKPEKPKKNLSFNFKDIVWNWIWLPILLSLICIGVLIYVNIYFSKKGKGKGSAKSKGKHLASSKKKNGKKTKEEELEDEAEPPSDFFAF